MGKYLAAGAAGLALGGIAGAVIEHETSMFPIPPSRYLIEFEGYFC
jgi:hypothetical protein